jgi:acylpyruvate hydrolase
MKLVSFTTNGGGPLSSGIQIEAGIVETSQVADLMGLTNGSSVRFDSTRTVLALNPSLLARLGTTAESRVEELADREALHAADTIWIGPPVPDPQKIICLGLNYRDHAEEAGLTPPSAPMFFAKFANSLAGPIDPIVPPRTTDEVDYEAELAVVIGRPGRDIPMERALEHVAGAMAFNDVSARDLQLANNLWTGGKAIDTFGPCGPALVTLDEIPDLQSLSIRARVNGEIVQDGNTASMIFGVAETVSFLSQIMTLEPGDIIATGTPAGVGNSRTPKLFLHPGDVVEVEIEGLGRLRNLVTEAD